MSIPDFQTLMRPILEFASDGKLHFLAEARESLAAKFKLTEEETKALLPSGRQTVFVNRVAWAKVYLGRAGLLDAPQRASSRFLNEAGRH